MPPSPTKSSADHTRHRHRLRRSGAVMVALIAVSLSAAACGGGSGSPGVASVGTTTTTAAPSASPGASNAANYADAVAYSGCMRTHGVPNMPDPNSQGNFITKGGPNGETVNGVSGIDPNSTQYISANKTCQHLLPNGGQSTPAEVQQALAQGVKYAQCIRSHGEPSYPDPVSRDGAIQQSLGNGINPNSPQFQAAEKACRSLQPGGGG